MQNDPLKDDQIACPKCGAVYQIGHEGGRIREKDDARCLHCGTVMTGWPLLHSLKKVEPSDPEKP
jgi:predicted Zn finger-like uncharacterized protein